MVLIRSVYQPEGDRPFEESSAIKRLTGTLF